MLTRRNLMLFAAISSLALASPALADDLPNLARVKVDLVAPPIVHPHEQATKQAPRVVQFKMNIQEKEVQIDDEGTKIHAMTFNGSIPGPMMVVHEGDYVELTLVNPSTNMMAHNIDFHSTTRTPQFSIGLSGAIPSVPILCRVKQVSVHSQTVPATSANPRVFMPKVPIGCTVRSTARSRDASDSYFASHRSLKPSPPARTASSLKRSAAKKAHSSSVGRRHSCPFLPENHRA